MKKHEFCRWCKNFYTEIIEIDENDENYEPFEDYEEINYCKLDNKEIIDSYNCCEKYQFDKIKFKKDKAGRMFASIIDHLEDNIEKCLKENKND